MTDDVTAPNTPEGITSFRAIGFFPADYAIIQDGKVYASGAYFGLLRFPAFPASLPAMALVAVLEAPFHSNQQDHVLEIGLLDSDDKPTPLRVQGTFRTAPKLEHKYGEPGTIPLAIPLNGLQFPTPGKYRFTMSVDGRQVARYLIDAVQVAMISPPEGTPPRPPE
jgi:uncharacterized protein DUF6941